MLKQNVLEESLTINNEPEGWIALDALDGNRMPGFGTKRIAKSMDGKHLNFTIGETVKGKELGLDEIIEVIIKSSGLSVSHEPTTNGNLKGAKQYPGFALADASEETVRVILKRVSANIESVL